jgi:ABC-type transport system involved in multi-copper enzyme maturation permease subunit
MKNVAAVAIAVVAGYVALKILFGFAGGLIGLVISVAWFALKILVFVGVAYWILSIIAPDMAKRVRERVGGTQPL